MKRLLLLSLCLLTLLPFQLKAQPEIAQLQPGQTADGVVYFLPKTAVRIHLLIEKQTYTPGQFARYAEHYLQLKGIQQQGRASNSKSKSASASLASNSAALAFATRQNAIPSA